MRLLDDRKLFRLSKITESNNEDEEVYRYGRSSVLDEGNEKKRKKTITRKWKEFKTPHVRTICYRLEANLPMNGGKKPIRVLTR